MIMMREVYPRSSAAAHYDAALVADVPTTLVGNAPEQVGAAQRDLARVGIDGLTGAAIDNEYASAAVAGLRRVAAQEAGRAA
jgi:hypothetical protein